MTTHVLMVIDGSGSMAELANDVRGGYNGYREQAIADGQEWKFTVSIFNTDVRTLCVGVPATDAPIFNTAVYRPVGGTALLDAIGRTIREFQEQARPQQGDKVVVFIHTDGEENSSREWNVDGIKALIKECTSLDWEFVFAGTGLESWADRDALGIPAASSTSNKASGAGVRSWYKSGYIGTSSFDEGTLRGVAVAGVIQDAMDNESTGDTDATSSTTT